MTSYDSPWKEVLDRQLRRALAFLFPRTEARIDWSQDHESLEQELRQIAGEGEVGVRLADKLIKVRTHSGDERVLHIEVQAQRQSEFEHRVYVYHYRGADRFGIPPEALVILADEDPAWRPTTYEVRLDYTRQTFEFEPVKLLDWSGRKETLREHENPFALFVLAHMESMRTRKDDEERARVKLDLLVRLAQRKLDDDEMQQWGTYLAWLLPLPRELDRRVYVDTLAQTKEKSMPFVTYPELVGREEGKKEGKIEGKREGLLAGLRTVFRLRFGSDSDALMQAAEKIEEPQKLADLLTASERASVEEIRKLLPASPSDPSQP